MTISELLSPLHEIAQMPWMQDEVIDVVERAAGRGWEPFAVQPLQPGVSVVWVRRRVGFWRRFVRYLRSKVSDAEPQQNSPRAPDDTPPEGGEDDVS